MHPYDENAESKFKEAETAIREAFDAALKHQDDFNNSETVTDVWMMYSNWRRLDVPYVTSSHDDTVTNVPTDTNKMLSTLLICRSNFKILS